jgi:GNAT superfamily N-acetyltransferase
MRLVMPSRMYNYVRARQLEGTYSDDCRIGTWITSSMRIYRGWGNPTEAEWPYDGRAENWPPKEPAQIDQRAKACRIFAYQRVRTFDECKIALAQECPVIASFEIAPDDWKSSGHIPMPRANIPPTDSHTVLIIGYDDSKRLLQFQNSWGADWGDKGFGFLPYSYFEHYQIDAWIVPIGCATSPAHAGSGILEITWGHPDSFAPTPLHGFEYFDASNDECVGWAFVVERQEFADIEELFVRPTYRRKGYGRRLAKLILASPHISGRSLRLWVSHADQQDVSTPAFTKTLQNLGLSVRPTSRRWAAYVAT